MPAVAFKDVDIVFGGDRKAALALIDRGASREEIIEKTQAVPGAMKINLAVERGDIIVLMGLSGSGKSTLMRAVNGLNKVVRGRVLVRDAEGGMVDVVSCDAATLRRLRRGAVSMVFQQFGLLPWRSVIENVAFGLELAGVGRAQRLAKARKVLETVNLGDWAEKKVSELSGGMQQRVGLARAFATDAQILLMDEPFSALDAQTRQLMQEELLAIWSGASARPGTRKTILYVTHNIQEAVYMADRVVVLSRRPGQVLAEVKIELDRPRTEAMIGEPAFVQAADRIWQLIKAQAREALVE